MGKALGQLIENARTGMNLSRENVAESLDVATSTVYRWEKGDLPISFENAVKLSKVLKKDLNYFIGEIQEESESQLLKDEISAEELVEIMSVILKLRGDDLEMLRGMIKELAKPHNPKSLKRGKEA